MGYEREVLIRARNRHKEAVEQYRKEQQQRLLEIYHAVPELERLDNQLRQTMERTLKKRWQRSGKRIKGCSVVGRSCCNRQAILHRQCRRVLCAGNAATPVMWEKRCVPVWSDIVRRNSEKS